MNTDPLLAAAAAIVGRYGAADKAPEATSQGLADAFLGVIF